MPHWLKSQKSLLGNFKSKIESSKLIANSITSTVSDIIAYTVSATTSITAFTTASIRILLLLLFLLLKKTLIDDNESNSCFYKNKKFETKHPIS